MSLSRKAMKALYDSSKNYNDGKNRRLICYKGIINGGMILEDIKIGKKVDEAGINLYLDIRHTCDHFGTKRYTGDYQEYYAMSMIEDIMGEKK